MSDQNNTQKPVFNAYPPNQLTGSNVLITLNEAMAIGVAESIEATCDTEDPTHAAYLALASRLRNNSRQANRMMKEVYNRKKDRIRANTETNEESEEESRTVSYI